LTNEERIAAIEENMAKLAAAQTKTEEALAALAESQAKTEKMVRGIGRYAMAIARDHESRIFQLENAEAQ
jgi:hypothetical protein